MIYKQKKLINLGGILTISKFIDQKIKLTKSGLLTSIESVMVAIMRQSWIDNIRMKSLRSCSVSRMMRHDAECLVGHSKVFIWHDSEVLATIVARGPRSFS